MLNYHSSCWSKSGLSRTNIGPTGTNPNQGKAIEFQTLTSLAYKSFGHGIMIL